MIKAEAIKAGDIVSLDPKPGAVPRGCYFGLVKATDKHGIRIKAAEWDGDLHNIRLSTEDIYIPWIKINSMLVCTE
jgi:hypothetical protein